MDDTFKVWGTELFHPPMPLMSGVQLAFWLNDMSWAPLDAPTVMPAGSTKRHDEVRPSYGCTRYACRGN
ncbi:hypothetical protein [Burkholderia vietnamiensis]|uniref:hypothetical protein n=1 Tax=Burkholderia vietnamiensis TaxID=60552 RepID=UPI00352EB7FF